MFVKVSKIELKWVLIGCIFEAKSIIFAPNKIMDVYLSRQFFFSCISRTLGEAPLYTKIRRNGFQLYAALVLMSISKNGISRRKSMAALKRYEATPAGMKSS